jgi:alkylation response protein AidB-like acyl-CoA dehydrogenase
MNLGFSEEQNELRQMVRRFLEAKSSEAEVRRLMATSEGYEPAVWQQMAEQLGLQAMIIPEAYGGAGFGYMESLIVFEAMGAALYCGPYFSTVALATNALLCCDDEEAKQRWLPSIAAGETLATLALVEDDGVWNLNNVVARATAKDGAWTITGSKNYVIDGLIADLILVVAQTDTGLALFAVEGSATGLAKIELETVDRTRKLARLNFEATPATLVGTQDSALNVLTKTLQLAAIALAAEQVGGAQRVLDNVVTYAKDRIQFGRPIGSFQAIKHKVADMLLEVESARSAATYAAWVADANVEELPVASSLAKAYCSDVYARCATENIYIHGGIGFTWEHHAHLYFKRAEGAAMMLGDPPYHRELVAQHLGI